MRDHDLADLRHANADLQRRLDEALAREAATADVLEVINSSPGELAPVFSAMLDRAMRLCEAKLGFLSTYDGTHFRAVALHGVPDDYAREYLSGPYRPGPDTTHDRLVRNEQVVHVVDLAAENVPHPRRQAVIERLGVRTILGVALRKEGVLVGALHVYRQEVRPFSDKQIALLQNFAAQAVIALENARLITETREALEQQTATAEVLRVINLSPGNLAPVFETILDKAHAFCGADHGSLVGYDGEHFKAIALRAMPEPLAALLHQPFPNYPGGAQESLLRGEPVFHVPDIQAREPVSPIQRASLAAGIRTLLIVPLRKGETLLGYISAHRRKVAPFSDKQIALLQNFAAQAVIAIENARLITETREALEQQTATSQILQVINSSPGDLAPVFDAMLDKAMRLCGFDYGSLQTYDGQSFRAVAVRVPSSPFGDLMRQPFKPDLLHGEAPLARLMNGAPYVQFADMAELLAQGHNDIRTRSAVELGGIRTALFVPLRAEGALLGYVSALRKEVRPFTDKQIALLENFAAQAVIAIENARLITETREALEQQTATAEVLGVINSSPGDLAPVFDAILEKAMRLCDAAFGIMRVAEGDDLLSVATRGVPASYSEFLANNPGAAAEGGIAARIRTGEPFVHIGDLKDDDRYRRGDVPTRRAMVDLGGARTSLSMALRRDRDVLGAIHIYRQEVRPFTDKQIALLQNFAAQAVIAMENARLITETREALEQQTATAEVLGVINSSPGDLTPVFDAILEKARSLCGAVHGALVAYDGEHFRAVATHGLPEPLEGLLRTPFRPNPAHQALLRGERLIHIADQAAVETDTSIGRASVGAGARTLLLVPLRKDGTLLGYITASRWEVRPFSDKEIALLENFAAQAVIAIENARLITEMREALDQQTATAEVLGVINSSPGDLAPVFEAMLEKATRLCDAAFGTLYTYDGEGFRAATLHGVPQPYAESLSHEPIQFARGTKTALGQIAEGSDFAHFDDVATEEGYMISARRLIELGGARTVMVVALRKDGKLLGAISAFRQEVRPFTDKQIALLQNFATQAVIAMENARLITETREALEQQTATAEVLGVINSSPGELGPVFDAMLEKAMRLCGGAFGLMIVSEGDEAPIVTARGVPAAFGEFRRNHPVALLKGPFFSRLLAGEDFVHTIDLRDDDAYRRGDPLRRAIVDLGGGRTSLIVALRRDREVLGAIHIYRQEVRPFTDKQIALLQNFAGQAVIAMENARLLGELRQRTDEVGELNRGLEARVAEQVDELSRVGRLKRFLAPQLAELIVSQGDEKILESHRREIVVVFCDLRGYTAFTETAEPEEVLDFLREYHGALGPLVSQFEGTLDQFSGDGIMVFFNDPVPCADPALRAVNMAVAMREAAGSLIAAWRERGRELGFGAGIAQGYATLGQIGFAERSGYTAIGTVCNVAARLCAEAKDGQILLGQRANVALKGSVPTEQVGALTLKGLTQPVVAYNVPLAATQPALRIIEGGCT